MKTKNITPLFVVIAFGTVFCEVGQSRGELPAPTRAFLQAHPGTHAMMEADRLVAIHGATFASDSDPNTTTDQFVAAFLAQNGAALGVDPLDLVLKDKEMIKFGQTVVYTYEQRIEGLPVHGSVVKISVALGATEKIAYVGIRLVPPPTAPLPADLLTGAEAIGTVANGVAYAQLTSYTQPEKVIFEAEDGSLHRAWRFSGSDAGHAYLFVVDTNSGELLAAIDRVFHADVSGRVTGHATPCCAADNAASPACCAAYNPFNQDSCPDEVLGMPGIEVNIDIPGVDPVYTNNSGYYSLLNLPVGQNATVTTSLTGRWIHVQDLADEQSLQSVPASRTVVTSPAPLENVDFVFNPTTANCPIWPSDADTAQVNLFSVSQETHDWFRDHGGSSKIDQRRLTAFEGYEDSCNAFFIPEDSDFPRGMYFTRAGVDCNNTAFSTVISHEYGHFILYEVSGAMDFFLHEGFADATSALFWDTSELGVDFFRNGQALRPIDEPDVRFNVCDSLPAFCSDCFDPHCVGLALGGAFWDLRLAIGLEATSKILAAFPSYTRRVWAPSVVLEVLMADDNDEDPSNGTPHKDAILNSFVTLHGWDNPLCEAGSAVKVAWEGPGSNPQEGTDYLIDYGVCPPKVTLKTTVKDGFAVLRWFVGRTESDGSTASLGTVTAAWSPPANQNITVRVGTRPTEPCQSVRAIDIPAQSPSTWSSLRVNLSGGVHNKLQCYSATSGANSGQGGLASGTVAARVGRLFVGGIGDGATSPGTLEVGGRLGEGVVGHISEGSTLRFSGLEYKSVFQPALLIDEEFDGRLEIASLQSGGIRISPASGIARGDIDIGGRINYQIEIDGDMEGDVLGNTLQAPTTDPVGIRIRIHGSMSGNFCPMPGFPTQLPGNSQIDCGLTPSATICGQAPICPAANIVTSVPANGTRDARQPHPLGEEEEEVLLASRQGIGSPNPDAREEDKIKLTLAASGLRAISHNCWSLCATGIELDDTGLPALLPNKISCIKESPIMSDTYQIILERPISGRHWTRIRYLGGEAQEVSYASLPANANGDYVSTPVDILDHIDSCVNQVRTPPHGIYSCDIDRDGLVNASDTQRLVDLLQGKGNFIVWNGQPLSINTCASGYGSWGGGGSGGGGGGGGNCTDPESCGGGIEPQAMVSGGGGIGLESTLTSEEASGASVSSVSENAYFADWFVTYLTTANPADSSDEEAFRAIVDSLAQWCVDHFTAAERAALAARLSDPLLPFAGDAGAAAAAQVAQQLAE